MEDILCSMLFCCWWVVNERQQPTTTQGADGTLLQRELCALLCPVRWRDRVIRLSDVFSQLFSIHCTRLALDGAGNSLSKQSRQHTHTYRSIRKSRFLDPGAEEDWTLKGFFPSSSFCSRNRESESFSVRWPFSVR